MWLERCSMKPWDDVLHGLFKLCVLYTVLGGTVQNNCDYGPKKLKFPQLDRVWWPLWCFLEIWNVTTAVSCYQLCLTFAPKILCQVNVLDMLMQLASARKEDFRLNKNKYIPRFAPVVPLAAHQSRSSCFQVQSSSSVWSGAWRTPSAALATTKSPVITHSACVVLISYSMSVASGIRFGIKRTTPWKFPCEKKKRDSSFHSYQRFLQIPRSMFCQLPNHLPRTLF